MSKRRPVSVAVATALGVASTAGMLTETVYAEDENIVEEIVVTGSRIRRADIDSPSPVTILTRQEIENKGITDVGYLLQRMPSMSGSPIGTTTNNGGNGSVQVDLRGLGPIRTLTLVNGKRTVDGGDYQTIPATMIERVETMRDYGNGSTDYGQMLADFRSHILKDVDSKTTVIILGDARNNYGDPKSEILREVYDKAQRIIWLNPEPKSSWTVGDAEMKKYAPCCHQTEVCNSLVHLERVVGNLLRVAG